MDPIYNASHGGFGPHENYASHFNCEPRYDYASHLVSDSCLVPIGSCEPLKE
jgi:hypothetical protein